MCRGEGRAPPGSGCHIRGALSTVPFASPLSPCVPSAPPGPQVQAEQALAALRGAGARLAVRGAAACWPHAPRRCPGISGRNCRAAGVVRCPSCPGSVTAPRTVLLHGRREQEAPKGSARREHPGDERAAASLCQNIGASEPERTAGRKTKRCPAAPVWDGGTTLPSAPLSPR